MSVIAPFPDILTEGERLENLTPLLICSRKMRVVSPTAGTVVPVHQGRCLLVGCILRAGAAEAIIRLFDQEHTGGPQTTNPENEAPGVRATTFDGFVGQTILMEKGIAATLDQSDAVAWVLFYPLTPV